MEEAPAQETELRERAAAARQVGYGDAAVPEEEVQLYGYRPTRKPARRAQKKRECCGCTPCGRAGSLTLDVRADDRMLVLFWIPILISECLRCCLAAVGGVC